MKSLLLCAALIAIGAARAETIVSVNDNKMVLRNGATVVVPDSAPDTLTVFDLAANGRLRVVGEAQVPNSVVGPPLSVAITPDGKLALVTSAMKRDPADASRAVPDNRISVVDITANPPRIVATVETGLQPAGISINRAGTLALVAHRSEGTVGVLRISGQTVTPVGKVTVGNAASEVSHATFTPDGRTALATLYGDGSVAVLKVDGETVTPTGRVLTVGIRPYSMAVTPDGKWAVVGNVGRGTGDADSASLISLAANPPRVVDTVSVGQTPEGLMVSPDSRFVAVTVMNGSNRPAGDPFLAPHGLLRVFRIANGRLTPYADAQVGTWGQGVAWSRDSRTLLMQNMVEKQIQVVRLDQGKLRTVGRQPVSGGPVAIRAVGGG